MKLFKKLIIMTFCLVLLFSVTSCVVVRKDNGKHRGWFKNRNNPHHPRTINPENSKSVKELKSKGKKNKLNDQEITINEIYQWQGIKPY